MVHARTGNFSSVTLPTVAGLVLDTVWATGGTPDTLYIQASALPSAVNRWQNPVSDNWSVAANWSRGSVPVASDSVMIDVAGTYTVTMDVNASVQALVLGAASNTQTLSVPSGRTLTLTGGAPSSVSANGRLQLAGTVNGTATLANTGVTTLIAGTIVTPVTNSGTLVGSGNSAINGTLTSSVGSTLRVGQVDGSQGLAQLTVANGFTNNGAIELTNLTTLGAYASQLTVTSGTVTNASGATITTLAGNLGSGSRSLSAAVNNQGTMSTSTGHPLLWTAPNNAVHTNSGLLDIGAADITLTMVGTASLTNTGTITVAPSRTLNINGGTFTLPVGGTLNGGGGLAFNSSAAASFATTFTLSALSATNSTVSIATGVSTASLAMTLAGATVNGAGSITNSVGQTLTLVASTINTPISNQGTLVASGTSAINGTLTTAVGSTLRVGQVDGSQSTAFLTVANGLTNNGAIELTNLTTFGAYGSQLTVNGGPLTNAAGATIVTLAGTLGGGSRLVNAIVDNQGAITTSTGHPLLWIGPLGATHTNTGTLDATNAGVSLTMTGSAQLSNAGAILVGAPSALAMSGGSFLHQSGATLTGLGVLTLIGGNTTTLDAGISVGAVIASNATINLQGVGLSTASMSLSLLGATVNGPGTLTNASGETLTLNQGFINAPFVNEGILIASGLSGINGTLTTVAGSTIQVGQIDGQVGQANLTVASGFTNNGDIEITNQTPLGAYGSQLTVTSGTLTNAAGGTITSLDGINPGGTRTLSAVLNNQGTLSVNPGAAGTLSLLGSLTNSGTVSLDLGGLTAGSQYDLLTISGAANLAGTLDVTTFGGFVPTIGNTFTVMTYASRSGSFTTPNLPVIALGTWAVGTNPTALVLSVN